MVYVALLRGINVGGNRVLPMAELKRVFEGLGLDRVQTYINSGNVVFQSPSRSAAALTQTIERALDAGLGVPVRVTLRSRDQMRRLVAAIPSAWVNDAQMKCDVMFLWDDVDRPGIVDELPWNPEIEDVIYAKGAVVWRIDRAIASRTRMTKIVGTKLYAQMTVRNPNTVRKLLALMEAI